MAEWESVMTATEGKVIYLYQRDPQEALERLNRITGLRFSNWPQSLVNTSSAIEPPEIPEVTIQADLAAQCEPAGVLSR